MIILTIFLVIILIAIILAVLLVGGSFAFVYFKYDLNLFTILNNVNTLNKTVDVEKLTPNAFDENDYISISNNVKDNTSGFINYSPEEGFTFDITKSNDDLHTYVSLSDKQVGAFANKEITKNGENSFQLLGETITYDLLQIDFIVDDKPYTTINTVVKIDLNGIKDTKDNSINLLLYFLPDALYVSSYIEINTSHDISSYSFNSKGLTFNNLTIDQTDYLLKAIKSFSEEDVSTSSINNIIGNAICGALIGNDSTEGLAYKLKKFGAKSYGFVTKNETDYFEIYR